MIEQPELRYAIEKAYWLIEKEIVDIKGIFLEESAGKRPALVIITESEKLKTKFTQLFKGSDDLFQAYILKSLDQKKVSGTLSAIYNPISTSFEKKLKGGIN